MGEVVEPLSEGVHTELGPVFTQADFTLKIIGVFVSRFFFGLRVVIGMKKRWNSA